MAEQKKPVTGDYDLSTPIDPNSTGLRQGLTSYGDAHFSLFLRKVFIKALGYSEDALSRPIIGIVNTYSSFNPCHANVPQLIEAVKRGVQLNGGLAIDFPTISIAESFASPTSMYLRNLMSMDTEEMIKAQPCDAVVLIGAYRAGKIDIEDISAINDELAPTGGTCGVMGTASTMACILVGLGMMPFAGATAPAVSSARLRIAEQTGGLAVALHTKRLKPQDLLTRESFLNAITVLQAIGGSTNAVVHLMAIIGRHPAVAGTITLDTFDEIGRKTPLIVDLKPSGDNYMTDFHNSGGMLALLHEIKDLLYLDAMTVTGRTLGEELASTPFIPVPRDSLVNCLQPFNEPLYPASALAVLRGNIAPGGAVIKQSASKYRHLLKHSGPAVVFAGSADMALRIDDPDLDVTPDSVLVLQNIGPVGNPGMPEAGLIPIPRKLAAQGVQDMLRLSDGRMSGTAGGTIVLHISPEAADPESVLGIVRDGDIITFDAEQRVIRVEISDEEIKKRIAEKLQVLEQEEANGGSNAPWIAKKRIRGYRGLYLREVNQAEGGGDFDFLTARGPSRGL
ncbi:putative dehydratase IlvD1 [Colletotrichum sp. SAR11_239]|nr:putative dehydratase IlvD1 [Colletotrichum sp. SAR11_239]